MRKVWSVLLVTAAALSTGAVAAVGSGSSVQTIVSGTIHEALFAVAFEQSDGVAVGAAGAIFNSSDGGKSWQAVSPAPTQLTLLGVSAAGTRRIAVGQMGLVLTEDGKSAWQKAESGTTERLFSVSMNTKGQAIAVGSFGTVLKSEDAGHSWSAIAPDWTPYTTDGQQPHLYAASIDEAGSVTVGGEFGLILRLAAGSKGWQLLHKGDASIFAMQLDARGNGYAVGQSGAVLQTVDAGHSWQTLNAGTDAILLSVHADASGHVVVSGIRDVVVSHDAGKSWKHLSDPLVAASWYAGLAQAGSDASLLAVGNAGQIVRLVD